MKQGQMNESLQIEARADERESTNVKQGQMNGSLQIRSKGR